MILRILHLVAENCSKDSKIINRTVTATLKLTKLLVKIMQYHSELSLTREIKCENHQTELH